MGNMTLVPGDMTSGEMTFGRLDRLLLIYRTCFVVNQGLKSEIYYTLIPLVSSHHRFIASRGMLHIHSACFVSRWFIKRQDILTRTLYLTKINFVPLRTSPDKIRAT